MLIKSKHIFRNFFSLLFLLLFLDYSTWAQDSPPDPIPPTVSSGTIFIDSTEMPCGDMVSHDIGGPYTVKVYATDNVAIEKVILSYWLSYSGTYYHVTMGNMGGGYYQGGIPGQPYGTTILYYVTAYDTSGNFRHYEHPWGDPFNLKISPMITEPSITINGIEYPLTDEDIIVYENNGPYRVSANVSTVTGISSVILNYCVKDCHDPSNNIPVPMNNIGGDVYVADIPKQPYGTTILIYITATCSVGHPEISEKSTHDPFIVNISALCDFSIEPGIERCFGGIGTQCEGDVPWPGFAFERHDDTCLVDGWMSLGSILHDICCLNDNTGYMCATKNRRTHICQPEFQLATYDVVCKRSARFWEKTFGPYPVGNDGDVNPDLEVPSGAHVHPDYEEFCPTGSCEVNRKGKQKIYSFGPCRYCICE